MEILLTNDDGIHTPAIAKVKQAVSELGNVTVVAPDTEQSGVSHSITFNKPIIVKKVFIDDTFFGFGISGTPSDCVKLAVNELMPKPPDLVISGVNMGANVGIHVLHSGTVAAAIEGAIFGIPSFAISLEYSDITDIENAAIFTKKIATYISKYKLAKGTLLNVNIPGIPWKQIKGIKVVKQYPYGHGESFDKYKDPNGQTFYWLASGSKKRLFEESSDVEALKNGYISVTPLQFDMTNHNSLDELGKNGLDDLV